MNTRIVAADRTYYTDNGGSGIEDVVVIDANPSWLDQVVMTNFAGGTRWLQVFDAAAAPVLNDVPMFSVECPDGQTVSIPAHLIPMRIGIVVAASLYGPLYQEVVNDEAKFFVSWKRKA